jgi:multidrug efflux pump subunit AcrA (membrane-fusion protein)
VLSQGPVRRVFLVREGRAFEVVVRVGSEDNGRVAILEGVQAGEQVVNEPPATLKDGDPLALRASGS